MIGIFCMVLPFWRIGT